jgi:hypothetical protein
MLVLMGMPSAIGGEEISLPESFKGVVPIYPGAAVALSMKTGEGTQVQLETGAKVQEVIEFYRKAMKDRGWGEQAYMTSAEGGTAGFKKDGQVFSVTVIAPPGEKSRVVLILAKE